MEKGTTVAKQFAFALLTASRSKPVRMLTWDQIDFENRTWLCPEESMKVKGRGDFVVYLSDEAIDLLKSMPRRPDTDYVFPNEAGKPFSDMGMRALILRLNSEALSRGEEPLLDREQTARLGSRCCDATWYMPGVLQDVVKE